MAPIKFEEQLKEKLEKRTLTPSSDGWANLSNRLDADDKKSKRPIYWWLSIAAMLVIMIAITIQVFNKDGVTEISSEIVNEESNEIKDNEDAILINNEDNQLVSEEVSPKEQIQEEEKTENSIIDNNIKQLVENKSAPKTKLVSNTKKVEVKNLELESHKADINQNIIKNPEIDKTAVAEVIENIKETSAIQLDREVDSLLKLASKQLTTNKLIKESSKTVDANALLEEVQDDMGQSFRSRVFEALKDSYETVKTAVAQRNN
ncbi:hypothetical protein [Winogradskyella vincentii]|uniref:Anti-sigma factor n=1 Tax=Winogradskyella vincentii TaxID=2877122 RepID=A0ABS7Y666_9FLAO|nr:hypothetical protein [Winogradskyella vincentii]MCA0154302.1 hypothetical protein [Winogradskyella vincentii]